MESRDVLGSAVGSGRRIVRGLRYRLRRLKYSEPYSRLYRTIRGNEYTLDVAGTTVRFHMRTRAEHRRFVRLTPSERPVLEDLVERIEPDDVFYDVGANVGLYTCVLGHHVRQVIAFEPDPETAARAEANRRRNGLDGVATVHRWALSDTTETAHLAGGVDSTVGEGRLALTGEPTAGTIDVETNVGDELVAAGVIPPPNVVKIDVEGTEQAVLDGLKETLAASSCRLVYCEVHPEQLSSDGRSAATIRETLERLGYDVTRLHDRKEEFFLRAAKSTA